MTIDERIEALTGKVEVLYQFQAAHEANLNRLFELQARNEEAQAKNERMLTGVIESIDSLARIAHAHEQRISRLEGYDE